MGIIPTKKIERLEFFEQHVEPWTSNAAILGLSPTAMTALAAAVGNARTAWNSAQAARLASKAATNEFNDTLSGAGKLVAEAIELIRNKAESTNDPSLYNIALIPPPATPSTIPPPGSPFDFKITLEQGGALGLKWKCNNPEGSVGTIYEVRRQAQGSPADQWTFAGATGTREFLDTTLPSSMAASGVNYQITAVRSTARGVPSIFNVRFGVSGGGGFTVTAVTPEVKLAA
jgi:hypothetical protein